MQKLLEKLDNSYRKSLKTYNTAVDRDQLQKPLDFKISERIPWPPLSFNPYTDVGDILKVIKPKDKVVLRAMPNTDKFLLVHMVEPVFNPELYKFKIGVTCANGNKMKMTHPNQVFFYATISTIREDANQSRPVNAVIVGRYEHSNDVIKPMLGGDTSMAYDVRLRKDEFGSLANPGTAIYVRGSLLRHKGQPKKLLRDQSSYLKTRQAYAHIKTVQLVQEAAVIIRSSDTKELESTWIVAQNKLDKALEFTPNDPNALTVRGALSLHRKKYNLAIADLEICADELPDAKNYLLQALAAQYEAEARVPEILAHIRRIDPNHELVLQKDAEESEKEKQLEDERNRLHLAQAARKEAIKRDGQNFRRQNDHPDPKRSRMDTTRKTMSAEERRKAKWADKKMNMALDKDVSKRNLADILSAIDHFGS